MHIHKYTANMLVLNKKLVAAVSRLNEAVMNCDGARDRASLVGALWPFEWEFPCFTCTWTHKTSCGAFVAIL